MNQPIMEFESTEQAQECLKEWQGRLFLNDWIIKVMFEDLNDTDRFGEVEIASAIKCAVIRISPKSEYNSSTLVKYCAEKTIVHELCHIVLDYVDFQGNKPIEAVVFEEIQHQKVEQMAKSLIMAKYDLPFDWFKNF